MNSWKGKKDFVYVSDNRLGRTGNMNEHLLKVSALVCNDVARRDVRAKTITNQNKETTEKQDFKKFATINRLARMKTSPSLINARPYVQCHAHLKPSGNAIRKDSKQMSSDHFDFSASSSRSACW